MHRGGVKICRLYCIKDRRPSQLSNNFELTITVFSKVTLAKLNDAVWTCQLSGGFKVNEEGDYLEQR